MRPTARILSRLAVALCLIGGCGFAVAGVDLRLVDPGSGATAELKHGDRALHIVFMATWCPPCVEELDELAQLEARWEDRGYRLVLVAVSRRQDAERLRTFKARREAPGRLLFDSDDTAATALRADRVPLHLVFDETGREVARSSSLEASVRTALAAILEPESGSSGRKR